MELAKTRVIEPDVGLSPALVLYVENQIDILAGVLSQPIAGVERGAPERRTARERHHLLRRRHRHRRPARSVVGGPFDLARVGLLPEPGVADRQATGTQVAEELVRVRRRHFAPVLEMAGVAVPALAQIGKAEPARSAQPAPKALHAGGRVPVVPLNTFGEVGLPGIISAVHLPSTNDGAILAALQNVAQESQAALAARCAADAKCLGRGLKIRIHVNVMNRARPVDGVRPFIAPPTPGPRRYRCRTYTSVCFSLPEARPCQTATSWR